MQVSSVLRIVVPLLFLYEAFIQYSSLCNITLGGVLKSGHKHILTANIIATRKQCSNQVLFVTFPSTAVAGEEKEEHTKQETSRSQGDILQRIANQRSSYALPVDCLKGSMLEAHVRFFNQQNDDGDEDPPKVVTYNCSDFTYEEFGTVAKILLLLTFRKKILPSMQAALITLAHSPMRNSLLI